MKIVHAAKDEKTWCGKILDLLYNSEFTGDWFVTTCEDCLKAGMSGSGDVRKFVIQDRLRKVRKKREEEFWKRLVAHDGRCYGQGCNRCAEEKLKRIEERDLEMRIGPDDEDAVEDFEEVGNLRAIQRPTPQADRIMYWADNWFSEFCKKSADYQTSSGNVSENFGLMGQYMKLQDKIHKLQKPMWDAEIARIARERGLTASNDDLAGFHFEGTEEILRDLIGHAFLALDFIEQRKRSEG